MLKEPTRRIRFLSGEEARRLLSVLPAHLADMDLVRRLAWIGTKGDCGAAEFRGAGAHQQAGREAVLT
jgi:hypothetical protein